MNECKHSSRLNAWHDGELPPDERAALDAHLAGCPACVEELAELRELSATLSHARPKALSSDGRLRLHAAVDRLPGRTLGRWAEAVAGLAAAVLIFAVVGLARQGQAKPPASFGVPEVEEAMAAPTHLGATPEELLARWMVEDLSGREEK